MAKITVRILVESDWQLYRAARLRALQESPTFFTARLADEAAQGEQFWRDRMIQSVRLVAERQGRSEGIASLAGAADDPETAEIFGLYVVPEARSTGVSWRLTEAAAALASQQGFQQLFYWVGIDNARAIAFAKNFGFRSTDYRRPSRAADLDLGDQEAAMVLPLVFDDTSVPNPTSGRPIPKAGALG
ncbi:MAG: GNAT family N-acetyltransferase [Microlunatus sp.]|nr:GNAT family N-acetyltransferase [Microlunatus sp.]MDN5803239.1 GNAT family N-acetyltransferase [Microlunatus sp.]